MRKSGILLPITSLPSEYGIGCFSKSAYEFIDFLKDSGQSYWQILPLCPTGFGDSPYQSFSTFAGNPYLISLKNLIDQELITKEECDNTDFGNNKNYIDYEKMYHNRFKILKKAYERSNIQSDNNFKEFVDKNSYWLFDYSLFMALKYKFGQKIWNTWDNDIKLREKIALEKYRNELSYEIDFWSFLQYTFFCQWNKLKQYANKNGVSIIGDIPIYVSLDSADAWANPKLFDIDENGFPTRVAGCPPDGFSKTGQLWGNPIYNWENHKKEGFDWWIKRFSHSFKMYDMLRIDHFRGFDEYYTIEYGKENAIQGEWKKGPGIELFNAVKEKLGEKAIIAEDLGFMTDTVKKLLSDCGYPGMKILQFAFDMRDESASNDHIPHNYIKNCVAYTGTHDNQTLLSWYKTITEKERENVRNYLCDYYTPDDKLNYPLISLILKSNASLCIVPIQDFLCLDDKARINTPSTTSGNWQWRLSKNELDKNLSKKIYNMTKIYDRL